MVPLPVFRLRQLVGACLVACALTAATSPVGVLATLYLQGVLSNSPSFAGLAGLPFSVSVIIGSLLGSRIARPGDHVRGAAGGVGIGTRDHGYFG